MRRHASTAALAGSDFALESRTVLTGASMADKKTPRASAADFHPEVLRLFDGYVHGRLDRRGFLDGAARFAVGGVSAAALLEALSPDFAAAEQVPKTDPRIVATTVDFPSPQGYGTGRGYLVRPASAPPPGGAATPTKGLPAVLVIHENRGLNPHIEDIARRLAAAVPFYGPAPATESVAAIRAPLLLMFADNDDFVNKTWPPYEAALKAGEKKFEAFRYPGTQHGFNNDTTPRFDAGAAGQAW